MLQLGALLSMLTPVLVAMVVQSHWPKEFKAFIAVIACVGAALGTVNFGNGSREDLMIALPALLVGVKLQYDLVWKSTGLAPWIEQITNLPPLRETYLEGASQDLTDFNRELSIMYDPGTSEPHRPQADFPEVLAAGETS